jgi:outer membrane protein TolC
MIKRFLTIIGLALVITPKLVGQIDSLSLVSGENDSTKVNVFTLENFLQLVLINHPVIRQADLRPQMADAEVRMARGAFDPKLTSQLDLKNFKDKEYFNLLNTTLKIPTWLPVDPKLSIERDRGEFIIAENSLPDENQNRQFNAGISLPVGRGLFIDDRRAMLQQAQIYQDIARAERIKMTNKLLLTAIKDYWDWYLGYQEMKLLERSLEIAQELFDRLLIDYEFGEAAVVDTVQAMITYQTRRTEYEMVRFNFINAGLKLSTHLWTTDLLPLELSDNVIPDTLAAFGSSPDPVLVDELVSFAMENHPEILKITGKLKW